MDVVVTGAGGFIGKRLTKRLESSGFQVQPVVRNAAEASSIEASLPPRIWRDGENTFHKSESFDALIDLAWDTRSRSDWDIQVSQLHRVEKLSRSVAQFDKVIGLGTSDEYGYSPGVLSEDAEPEMPISPYGWSKWSAQLMVRSRCAQSGVPLVWLRPFTVYGEGQNGEMLIPYAIACAKQGKAAQFTSGEQFRDFVHVDDVIEAIVLALDESVTGTFNVGTGKGTRVRDIVLSIAEHFDSVEMFQLGALESPSKLPLQQVADTKRASKLLGFDAVIDIEAGLERVITSS